MGWWTDTVNWSGDALEDAADFTGDLWNDVTGKTASREAAKAQKNAADKASNTQLEMFNKNREDMLPFLQMGQNNLRRLSDQVNSGSFDARYSGPEYKDQGFSFGASDMQADPGYQFRMDAANKALERSAAAKGGLLGGGQLTALSKLNQGLASQEYGNAFTRARGSYESDRAFGYGQGMDRKNEFYQNQGNSFNRLASLAGVGQAATNSIGAQRGQLGQALAGNTMAAGNAQAAGIVGGYNGQANALQGIGKLIAMYYGAG